MIYKTLKLDLDPVVSGVKTGTSQARFMDTLWERSPELNEFMFGLDTSDYMKGNIPAFNVKLDGLYLDKSANHTDFISVGSLLRGFIVSNKVKKILQTCRLPEHRFYETVFYQPDKKTRELRRLVDYWWFYFQMETGEQNVNFEASIFDYSVHNQRYPDQVFSSNTFADYQQIFEQYPPAMKSLRLVLKPSFDHTQDFWGTRFLTISDYVSEELLEKFKSAKITGYKVNEPKSELIFE